MRRGRMSDLRQRFVMNGFQADAARIRNDFKVALRQYKRESDVEDKQPSLF
jgi:hypothetical protein